MSKTTKTPLRNLQIGQMFGNNPISSLLLLSTVETRIQKDAEFESGLCRDMSFLTKFKTIIPYGQAAKPTENESKFILDGGHFVWILKNLLWALLNSDQQISSH